MAEIEAIYQDLEQRRLDALYQGDEAVYRALFANGDYLNVSLDLLEIMEFIAPPDSVEIEVVRVLNETDSCVALETRKDLVGVVVGAESAGVITVVLERIGDLWGFSYSGTGWACDGPHPFDS